MRELQEFTAAEVAAHNSAKSLWIIVHGKVYDITKFHPTHPGQPEVLLKVAGSDASLDFDNVDHSLDAKDIMLDYLIGRLKRKEETEEEEKV